MSPPRGGRRPFHAAVTAAAHSALLTEFTRSVAGRTAESRVAEVRLLDRDPETER